MRTGRVLALTLATGLAVAACGGSSGGALYVSDDQAGASYRLTPPR